MINIIHQDDNEERVQFYKDCNRYWNEARRNIKIFDPDNQAAQEGGAKEANKSFNLDYVSAWHNFAI